MKIPITKPFFGREEKEAVVKPLETGWVVQGPYVKEFEELMAEFTGARFARATSSCTTALHLALLTCGVRPGDQVILPSFTFVASANSVRYAGAEPVLVDIDLDTFNLDVNAVRAALTDRTAAIIPVHMFGLPADMDPLLQLAAERRLVVVEDAACGLGAFYKGRHAGTMGAAGCLSFHPRKPITTGEGGMVLTGSEEVARKVEVLRDHGADSTDLQRHASGVSLLPSYDVLGFNYRMTDLQGAVGVAQMGKIDEILSRRRELAERYDRELADLDWLRTPSVPEGSRHGYQSYVCTFAPSPPERMDRSALESAAAERLRLMGYLESNGVSVRQGTHAVHTLGYYKNALGGGDPWALPNSLKADRLTLAIPLFPGMSEAEQDRVIEVLRDWK